MKKIGFLGCGKIGHFLLDDIKKTGVAEIAFIQDPFYSFQDAGEYKILKEANAEVLLKTDLVVETATADVLKENFDKIIRYCDLMVFSVTAFADQGFYEHAVKAMEEYNKNIYLPHGAILGIDGIADGRKTITSVSVTTTKNPKSLNRNDTVRTVVYDGSARGACKAYPRNVNVHATCALAGIGFDRTHSTIISDPAVHTNSHHIIVAGEGVNFDITVSSFSEGGVTGKYTPYSAAGSLHRILDCKNGFCFA